VDSNSIPSPGHCHSLPNPVLAKAQQIIQLSKHTNRNGVSYQETIAEKKKGTNGGARYHRQEQCG